MKTRQADPLPFSCTIPAVLLLLLLCSCNSPTANNNNGKDALQVIRSSSDAMKHLKTLHFAMNNIMAISDISNAETRPRDVTVNSRGDGDEVLPDYVALNLTINRAVNRPSLNLKEVISGKKVYIKNQNGQWYVLNAAVLTQTQDDPFAPLQISNYNDLLTQAQQARLVDHGIEDISGQNLRHITAMFSNNMLENLLRANGQLNFSSTGQPKNEREQRDIQLADPTLDIWIDQSTAYVHRMALKYTLNVNMSTAATPTSTRATAAATTTHQRHIVSNNDTVIDYSAFNARVFIFSPPKATPATSMQQVFS